jgi:hypothetical protein
VVTVKGVRPPSSASVIVTDRDIVARPAVPKVWVVQALTASHTSIERTSVETVTMTVGPTHFVSQDVQPPEPADARNSPAESSSDDLPARQCAISEGYATILGRRSLAEPRRMMVAWSSLAVGSPLRMMMGTRRSRATGTMLATGYGDRYKSGEVDRGLA